VLNVGSGVGQTHAMGPASIPDQEGAGPEMGLLPRKRGVWVWSACWRVALMGGSVMGGDREYPCEGVNVSPGMLPTPRPRCAWEPTAEWADVPDGDGS